MIFKSFQKELPEKEFADLFYRIKFKLSIKNHTRSQLEYYSPVRGKTPVLIWKYQMEFNARNWLMILTITILGCHFNTKVSQWIWSWYSLSKMIWKIFIKKLLYFKAIFQQSSKCDWIDLLILYLIRKFTLKF